jgi:ribosomal protein S18 acetylase RimI-like enzyme
MGQAIRFSKANGYSNILLWTTSDLIAAGKLYESFGFQITEEITRELWGATVTEQRYELNLGRAGQA